MAFDKLIAMKKSRKFPCEGDVFCLQPLYGVFYFGKVIKCNLKNPTPFINGNLLIYIYDVCADDKLKVFDLENRELLIAPIIVNKQPWQKGYFETLYNDSVCEREKNLDYGFLNIVKKEKEYLDIDGNVIHHTPQYCGIYGLGSYGVVGKEVQKAIGMRWKDDVTK